MKKNFLILFFIFVNSIYNNLSACDKCWDNLIHAISFVESRGNEKAISKDGKCVGILQIKKILVDECNRIGNKKFTYQDRFNKEKSIEMFNIIQNYYNPTKSTEKAIRLWNGGPNYKKSSTQNYYLEVLKKYKKQC